MGYQVLDFRWVLGRANYFYANVFTRISQAHLAFKVEMILATDFETSF